MRENLDFQRNFLSKDKTAFASFDFNEILEEFLVLALSVRKVGRS